MTTLVNNEIKKNKDFEALSDLCDLIESNKVIPIIGFGLFDSAFADKRENKNVDSFTILAEAYNKELCDELRKNLPISSGFDLINGLAYCLPEEKKATFRNRISRIISELRDKIDPVPDCFEQLARIKPFKFYVNATVFNSLELAVNTFKVPKAQNDDDSNYSVVNYNSRLSEEVNFHYEYHPGNFSTTDFKKPIICNLLGTHDKSGGEYVLTDVHYMELLVRMLAAKDSMFSNLSSVFEDAALLFIGCNFPDWIFRFFLRFCFGSKMMNKGALEKNFLIEELTDEHSKAFLIGNHKIKKFNEKPDVLVNRIYNELEGRNRRNNIEESFFNNRVFISYNREDFDLAGKINYQLKAKNIDTFFDENRDESGLEHGDDLDPKIRKAIDSSSHFLAILTSNLHKKENMKKYYKREWNYAAENKDIKVIYPLWSNDYNPHTLLDEIFTDKAKDIFLRDSSIFVDRQYIAHPEYVLTDQFLKKIKVEQYKQRLSGI